MIANHIKETAGLEQNSKERKKISSYILAIYLVLLPISTALSGIVGDSSIQNYVAVIYFITILFENSYSRKIILRKRLFPIYIYFIYTLVSAFWNFTIVLNWYFYQYAITTLMVLFITSGSYSENEYRLFKNSIYISVAVVIVVSLINISSAFSYRLTIVVSSVMDPNDFGCGLSVIIALCLSEILKGEKKGFNYLIIFLMIIIIFLTGSRGAMMMALAMILTWILFTKGTKRVRVIFVVIIGALLIYVFAFDKATSFLLNRFSVSVILEGGGSGRYKIWSAAIRKFLDSNIIRVLFGYGHGGFREAVNYIAVGHSNAYESHNMYINELIEGGIVGLLLQINCFVNILAISKKNIFGVLLIIGFMVEGLTLDCQVFRVFSIVISFSYIWSVRKDEIGIVGTEKESIT